MQESGKFKFNKKFTFAPSLEVVFVTEDREKPEIFMTRENSRTLIVHCSGSWTVNKNPPDAEKIIEKLRSYLPLTKVIVNGKKLHKLDSIFVLFLLELKNFAQENHLELSFEDIPTGALHLLQLSKKGEKIPTGPQKPVSFFAAVGQKTQAWLLAVKGFHEFLGEVVLGIFNLVAGKARLRFSDFLLYTQEAGAMALPIVSLVSFLVGLILAFVATVQLKIFGAQIFVADLVGIAMARDMGAMMVGIIMAGRTGATYAAQIGTMQVNEEVDALRTLGLKPIEFLVIPRIFALALMMPLLCIYADLLGIAGGALVGAGFSDVTLLQYISETKKAVPLIHFFIGIGKSLAYGLIVALVGCQKGLSCGRSAAAVGEVTTSAVVTSIVWIIVACAIITVICYVYGI